MEATELASVDNRNASQLSQQHHDSVGMEQLTGSRTNLALREDIPPDGGYGWICIASVLLINAHTWGVNAAWGVFLANFLSTTTFPGATRLQFAFIGGLSCAFSFAISPLVTWTNENLGTRTSLLLGSILVAVSMLTSSFATQTWHLFLSQGATFGFGMGFLYITASAILPQWFGKRRSLALGIASSGAGIGGIAYNLGAGAGIEKVGWRWTYIIFAITTGVVNFTCSLLLKDRNKSVQPHRGSFSSREYSHLSTCLIIMWGMLTELGLITLLYSLPDYAVSIGLTAQQGSVVGAILNLGLAVGRPSVGFLSDAFGRINIAAVGTALCGIFCLSIWIPAKTYAVLLTFAFLSGTVVGVFWGAVVPVTAEVVGLQRLPVSFAMIVLPMMLPTTFAEPIALQLVSASGYLSAQIFVGCVYIGGAVSLWGLRSWKIRELEEDERREHEGLPKIAQGSARKHEQVWLTPRGLLSTKIV